MKPSGTIIAVVMFLFCASAGGAPSVRATAETHQNGFGGDFQSNLGTTNAQADAKDKLPAGATAKAHADGNVEFLAEAWVQMHASAEGQHGPPPPGPNPGRTYPGQSGASVTVTV